MTEPSAAWVDLQKITRHEYLPTNSVGRLYCWPCWDRLENGEPELHQSGRPETCDHCGQTITPNAGHWWELELPANEPWWKREPQACFVKAP